MEDAIFAARKSKDRSRKVGCVIVNERQTDLVRGWNGFPRGVNDDIDERHQRPDKYAFTEHAERNAIFNAAAEGVSLRGTTIYTSLMPCCDCARAIIQSGIRRVVTFEPTEGYRSDLFRDDISKTMFAEAGVQLDFLSHEPSV